MEDNLSEKIEVFQDAYVEGEDEVVTANVITTKNVKEKIQNDQKRLKESVWATEDAIDEIDKIFKEEFGDKLI